MKTRVVPAGDPNAINYAIDVLNQHGLVAFPTDTVYGLAAGVFDVKGVDRLYSVKGRNQTKAIAVLLSSLEQMSLVTSSFPAAAAKIAAAFWPGPLTLVVPCSEKIPKILSRDNTIGVRIPNHRTVQKLIAITGPLAVTSANMSGGQNTLTAADVLEQLDGRIDYLIDGGKTPGGEPSTVLDCTSEEVRVLREGPISLAKILAIL